MNCWESVNGQKKKKKETDFKFHIHPLAPSVLLHLLHLSTSNPVANLAVRHKGAVQREVEG